MEWRDLSRGDVAVFRFRSLEEWPSIYRVNPFVVGRTITAVYKGREIEFGSGKRLNDGTGEMFDWRITLEKQRDAEDIALLGPSALRVNAVTIVSPVWQIAAIESVMMYDHIVDAD